MTVPNPDPAHDRITDTPATDVEHDDDGCTTCNPRRPDRVQEFVEAWLDRHDDMQLARIFGVTPGEAGDLREWLLSD